MNAARVSLIALSRLGRYLVTGVARRELIVGEAIFVGGVLHGACIMRLGGAFRVHNLWIFGVGLGKGVGGGPGEN